MPSAAHRLKSMMRWCALGVLLLTWGVQGQPVRPLQPARSPQPVPSLQPVLSGPATTAERWRHLTENEGFGTVFFVDEVRGDETAPDTVFVIPQYHRSTTLPLWWTSLGAAVARVQNNIDQLVTTLLETQAVNCVGTEGTSFARVDRPWELLRTDWHLRDLRTAAADAVATLAQEGVDIQEPVDTLVLVVEQALREHRAVLDGVGQAQLRAPDRLFRFGLEDEATNRRAVALAKKIEAVDQKLVPLLPTGARPARDALTALWLAEWPSFERAILSPYEQSVAALEQVRASQRGLGADHPARVLTRLLSLVQRLDDEAIQSGVIRAVSADFSARTDEATVGEDPAKTASQKKRRDRLQKKRDRLAAQREAITMRGREKIAAHKVWAALAAHDGVCAAVMGANHEGGLVEALLARAAQDQRTLGVIVVRPFSPDD